MTLVNACSLILMTDEKIDFDLLFGVVYGNHAVQPEVEVQRLVHIGTETHTQHLHTRFIGGDKPLYI